MVKKIKKSEFGQNKIKKASLDELDLKLVEELRVNSNQTWRELAKKLGVSPVTINNRVKHLEKEGVIYGYGAYIDYVRLGFELAGWMGITVEGKNYDTVLEQLAQLPEVDSLHATTGDYDLIVLFRARDRDDFYHIVQKIYRIENLKTKTYFAVPIKEGFKRVPSTPKL